jgi:hypothetical protein
MPGWFWISEARSLSGMVDQQVHVRMFVTDKEEGDNEEKSTIKYLCQMGKYWAITGHEIGGVEGSNF